MRSSDNRRDVSGRAFLTALLLTSAAFERAFAQTANVEQAPVDDRAEANRPNPTTASGPESVGRSTARTVRRKPDIGSGAGAGNRATTTGTASTDNASAGSVTLPTIDVSGNWQNLFTPNYGFTAKETATGTKTDTPIIEVPQSISVVTRGQLDARNVETDSEALLYTPGVFAQPFGSSLDQFNPFYYIRGFPTSFGGSYVDYLVSPFNYRYEPYGIDRYDILRGPTSVLYGQSDPGGLINRTTKRPLAESANELRFQAGNYNWKTIAGDTTGPVDPDGNLLYRFTFLYRNANNVADFNAGPVLPDNRLYIAPAVTWNIAPDTSLTILGSVLADDASQPAYFTNSNYSVTHISTNRPGMDDFNYKQHSIGYEFEHRFDDTLVFRQRFRHAYMDFDTISLNQWAVGDPYLFASGFSENRNDLVLDNNLQKLLTTGPIDHMILLGFDYQHLWDQVQFKYNFDDYVEFDPNNPDYSYLRFPLNVDEEQNITTDLLGLYFQDQMKIYERWILTLGGRFDWATTDLYGFSFGETLAEMTRDNAFSWRAGVNYLFDNGLAPYFSYATSFLPTGGANTLTGVAFKPTTGEQYEVGIKYQPPGTRSLFTFAAYDLTKQNVVTSSQLPGGVILLSQTGEINSRGIELEGTSDLTDHIRVVGSYSYTVAKIINSLDGSAGQTPKLVPRSMASLWLDYKVLGDTVFGGLSFGGGIRYVGSSYAWETDTINFPDEGLRLQNSAYTLYDAAVRYDLGYASPQLKGAQLAVNATNVFNHGYQVCYSRFDCRLGVPMTVMGTLRYRF